MREDMQHYNSEYSNYGRDLHLALKIISFLIPIIGFLIYNSKKNKNPRAAKSACETAIAGYFFQLFLQMLLYAYSNRSLKILRI